MNVPELLKTLGEGLQSNATVKNVFGEPVTAGNRTIIPVARVSYAFGGGGGTQDRAQSPERDADQTAAGGGGGGRLSAMPAGVIELSPEGTRFISFNDWRRLFPVVAISLSVGFLVGVRRAR
ncbi:MAG: hypothetical protein H7039_08585 [Bryobacteraceae bacterium]|nr:hypothetical protein [Bryobacteraceae bacterium]